MLIEFGIAILLCVASVKLVGRSFATYCIEDGWLTYSMWLSACGVALAIQGGIMIGELVYKLQEMI